MDGYGIIWGRHQVDEDDLPEREDMLRDAQLEASLGYPCVGEDRDCEIIWEPEKKQS